MTSKQDKSKEHYLGHRARMRERFLKSDGKGFMDYELLELALFTAIPRQDVKPIAKDLLKKFGSYAGVITASTKDLENIKGLGEAAIVALKTIQISAERLLQDQVMNTCVLSNWQQVLDYCQAAMAHHKTEQFRILFLDNKNKLIADEIQQTGTVDHTPLYPREVVKRALDLSAAAIILVHNHPSGDATPSRADIEMTNLVGEAAQVMGIKLHDHVIIGKKQSTSFRLTGLITG